jgi:hypothetical protein
MTGENCDVDESALVGRTSVEHRRMFDFDPAGRTTRPRLPRRSLFVRRGGSRSRDRGVGCGRDQRPVAGRVVGRAYEDVETAAAALDRIAALSPRELCDDVSQ